MSDKWQLASASDMVEGQEVADSYILYAVSSVHVKLLASWSILPYLTFSILIDETICAACNHYYFSFLPVF